MSVDSRFAAPALASLKDCALDDPRLPTPLFVIDSQKLEKNLRRAQDRAAKLGVAFRPHLKTHKSIGIALRQMTTPQGPATVSTLAEARYFGARGVTDLIYAVGIAPQKLAEVSRLRSLGADIKIILDSAEAARAVSAFCSREKTTIPVLLEIDVDGHRSGIRPDGAELLPAAAALADGAELVGVLTHAGDSYECKTTAEIEAAAEAERAGIVLAAERLRAAGHTVKIVSAGSTPTLMFAKDETGVTEMRAGVCALFDLFMSNVGACTVDDIAGSVLATVIGRQVDKRRVILDCGLDGKPLADGTIVLTGTNQEHGILTLPENSPLTQEDFPIGRRLRILPNHACPTAAPYGSLVLIENGRVAEVLDHVRGWD